MSKITNRQNLKLEAGNYCLEQVRVPHSGGHKEEGEGEHQVDMMEFCILCGLLGQSRVA